MLPRAHAIVSAAFSIPLWLYFGEVKYVVIAFLFGTLIDLDHVIDFTLNHRFTLNAIAIYRACVRVNLKRLYLFCHSYELVALLWISIYIFNLGNFWKAMAVGITQHMIFDQFTNPLTIMGYFLLYRHAKGYQKELLMRPRKNDFKIHAP